MVFFVILPALLILAAGGAIVYGIMSEPAPSNLRRRCLDAGVAPVTRSTTATVHPATLPNKQTRAPIGMNMTQQPIGMHMTQQPIGMHMTHHGGLTGQKLLDARRKQHQHVPRSELTTMVVTRGVSHDALWGHVKRSARDVTPNYTHITAAAPVLRFSKKNENVLYVYAPRDSVKTFDLAETNDRLMMGLLVVDTGTFLDRQIWPLKAVDYTRGLFEIDVTPYSASIENFNWMGRQGSLVVLA